MHLSPRRIRSVRHERIAQNKLMRQLHTFHGNDELLKAFNECGVRYLVVGGLAVQYFVESRSANDLDILVETSIDNADRIFAAMEKVGIQLNFDRSKLAAPFKGHMMLHDHCFYADVLTTDLPIDFSRELGRAEQALINMNEVKIASRELLILIKSQTERDKDADREKDARDIELLQNASGSG